MLSGSSNTTSYSVINSENTGAGIFKVGEKTMPTKISKKEKRGVPLRIVILFS